MEIHGLAHLKSTKLRVSTESGKHVLFAQEATTGRLMKLSEDLAQSLLKFKRRFQGHNEVLSKAELTDLAIFGAFLEKTSRESLKGSIRFNPLFMNISLFSPSPYQRYFVSISNLIVSYVGALLLIFTCILALWISTATNFALVKQVGNAFSLEAILTFAFMTPFLKILHEFGHLLTATRFGVPVRNAGVLLVGLYPLPFVDCTEADFRATRGARIIISLGGLFADLSVALIAFLLWHFAESEVIKQICSNIFVFNTLTTLIFNINPLLKLDGYFAISDAVHRRNFYQEAMDANRRLRTLFSRFLFVDAFRFLKRNALRLLYSILSFSYKLYILLFILWTLVPQFFGLGLLVAIWGGVVMFFMPLFQEKTRPKTKTKAGFWKILFVFLFIGLAFLPMKYRVNVPVKLDIENIYQVRAATEGVIAEQMQAGEINAGDALMRLENVELNTDLTIAREDRALYSLIYEGSRQAEPLANEAALRQLNGAEERLLRLEEKHQTLQIFADKNGIFWPLREATVGMRVNNGDPVGILIPSTKVSHIIGNFPEVYAEKFQQASKTVEFRGAGDPWGKIDIPIETELLRSAQDENTGVRGFLITGTVNVPPVEANKTSLHLQLSFKEEPVWRHVVFHYHRLRIEFLAKQDANNSS